MCRFAGMHKYCLGIAFLSFMYLWSCEEPVITVEEGELVFSADTVLFDSIFTTFQTPSERLWVYNTTGKNINISRIWLEAGEQTEFKLVVDGILQNDVEDIVLAKDDSLLIFVSLKSELKNAFTEEYIAFQIGENVQRKLIHAYVIDAFFLTARLEQEEDADNLQVFLRQGSFFFSRDTLLTPEKPIIMDGPIIIPEGVTVTIQAGTELFFTPYKFQFAFTDGSRSFTFFSTLIVNGTLIVEGAAEDPVVFEGSRLDEDYRESPAQWRGIRFTQTSQNNIIRHAIIKNAIYGVEVDSIAVGDQPKLLIQYSEIRNMSAYGILGFGASNDLGNMPALVMENSVVNTCKDQTVRIIGGGNYEFYNCTFANFSLRNFSRRTPQIRVANYLEGAQNIFIYPSRTVFTNSIIYGNEDAEIAVDSIAGFPYTEFVFDHCLIQYAEDSEVPIAPYVRNTILNQDPLFKNFLERDYRILDGSPAIDQGKDLSDRYLDDKRNRMDSLRNLPFDIGAFEYIPQ